MATPKLALGYGVYKVTVEYESSADDSLLYFASESVQASEVRNMDKYHSGIVRLEAGSTKNPWRFM